MVKRGFLKNNGGEIYIDKKGNKISIEGPGLLLYHHRSSGHVLTFERPVKAHGTGGTWRGEKIVGTITVKEMTVITMTLTP